MQPLSLLHIAPTLAAFFDIELPSPVQPVKQILDFMTARDPSVVVLVVVDSLDWQLYADFATGLEVLHALASQGLLYECETVSTTTTPAIASILTGLLADEHEIFTSEDVGTSEVNSILEMLDDVGKPTAAILETAGTKPLVERISYVCPVDDREDIEEYDALITSHAVSVLKKREVRFIFAHLRAIDRFAHRGNDLRVAAAITSQNIGAIAKAVKERNGMLLICGDHEAHLKERKASGGKGTVPLIVACP
ncbi:MAG: alkaline phosphatase family protein [Methanomicrobia archaeon]|nr:alkaline phosphatase family protein [Methanomicrobia archaeon]